MSPHFAGFSTARKNAILVPPELTTEILAEVQDIAELKVLLTVLRLVAAQKELPPEQPRAISFEALRSDPYLARGLSGLGAEMTPLERLDLALERAVGRGTLLHVVYQGGGHAESYYLLNTAANRQHVKEAAAVGPFTAPPAAESDEEAAPAGIFRLYEQNVGLITPLLAEELTEAGGHYPADWVEDAFREAVSLNHRSWRYIRAILERWEREGRGERPGRGTLDMDKYTHGRYAYLFRNEPEEGEGDETD